MRLCFIFRGLGFGVRVLWLFGLGFWCFDVRACFLCVGTLFVFCVCVCFGVVFFVCVCVCVCVCVSVFVFGVLRLGVLGLWVCV